MARKEDPQFDISFYESVLRRQPGYTDVIELLGGLYTKTGRIADGLKMDRKLVKLLPANATARYNLACSLALSKRKSDAIKALLEAVELGYSDYEWMAHDPDLASLQNVREFTALLAKLKPRS
jgi:tetratricopeptide (TPR) repeat protein